MTRLEEERGTIFDKQDRRLGKTQSKSSSGGGDLGGGDMGGDLGGMDLGGGDVTDGKGNPELIDFALGEGGGDMGADLDTSLGDGAGEVAPE